MQSVSEFVVIAPASHGKATRYAEGQILSHLAGRFPYYNFRIEAFGPYVDDEDFTVIPIMNRASQPGDVPDVMYMCSPLDPRVIPEIMAALKAFTLVRVS